MENLYRQYFDEMPGYVTVQDPEHRILDANRRFRKDFGDPAGGTCYKLYKNRKEKCQDCAVERSFEDGESHGGEEVVVTREGKEVPVSICTRPIRDEQGNVVAVMEILSDIPDSRLIQSKLSSLDLLVSTISHGIKGQLTGLDGGIYLMNSGSAKNDTERVKKGLAMVLRNLGRVRSMVLNILYYSKDREPLWTSVAATDLVKDLADSIKKRAEETGVDFSTEIAAGVGEFEADPKATQSMLANILEYALDACATDPGKGKHWVRLSVSQDAGNTIFRVQHNGRGIDPETREKVLNLFYVSKIEGAGLGLFISNKIVNAHGGSLEVDSTPDVGTTFTVRLPKR
jgi:PAS domain S-box-containing protein